VILCNLTSLAVDLGETTNAIFVEEIMTGFRILVFYAIVLLLSISLCESTQQRSSGDGKQELLKKIEAQQAEIDELERRVEAATKLFLEVATELEKCRGGKPVAEKDKASTKISKKTKRSNPSTVKKRTKTSSRRKATKRKAGCPCKRKKAKAQRSKK
jgi:hypothetical protein